MCDGIGFSPGHTRVHVPYRHRGGDGHGTYDGVLRPFSGSVRYTWDAVDNNTVTTMKYLLLCCDTQHELPMQISCNVHQIFEVNVHADHTGQVGVAHVHNSNIVIWLVHLCTVGIAKLTCGASDLFICWIIGRWILTSIVRLTVQWIIQFIDFSSLHGSAGFDYSQMQFIDPNWSSIKFKWVSIKNTKSWENEKRISARTP